jgi:hypothetical protein
MTKERALTNFERKLAPQRQARPQISAADHRPPWSRRSSEVQVRLTIFTCWFLVLGAEKAGIDAYMAVQLALFGGTFKAWT